MFGQGEKSLKMIRKVYLWENILFPYSSTNLGGVNSHVKKQTVLRSELPA